MYPTNSLVTLSTLVFRSGEPSSYLLIPITKARKAKFNFRSILLFEEGGFGFGGSVNPKLLNGANVAPPLALLSPDESRVQIGYQKLAPRQESKCITKFEYVRFMLQSRNKRASLGCVNITSRDLHPSNPAARHGWSLLIMRNIRITSEIHFNRNKNYDSHYYKYPVPLQSLSTSYALQGELQDWFAPPLAMARKNLQEYRLTVLGGRGVGKNSLATRVSSKFYVSNQLSHW